MMCGIHRVEKRGRQAVGGLQAEANRNAEQPKNFEGSDIDWNRTAENVRLVSSDNWLKDINKTIEDAGVQHVRKDAIVMLDGLYTASPEFFKMLCYEDQMQYFKDCLQFHIDTYCHGDESLVKNAVIHFDETTPHMQVCSVPITEDGRLSAKDVMGNKAQYHKRQDLFYEKVTKDYHLERGEVQEPGRKRKHRDQMQYKAEQAELKVKESVSKIAHNKAVIDRQVKEYNERKEALEKLPVKRKELSKVEEDIEIARGDLSKTLELKAKAAQIKTPFRSKDSITIDRAAYEELQSLANEVHEDLKEAQEAKRYLKEREEAVKAKEVEIEPLHQQAKDAKENFEKLIEEKAFDLIEQADLNNIDVRIERMIEFMARYKMQGVSLDKLYKEEEHYRNEKIMQKIMNKHKAVHKHDWDMDR